MSGKRHVLETDALVIGAGPGGCAAAIQLLKCGKRVVILERSGFPRPAPGETFHPGIEPLLNQLDVLKEAAETMHVRHCGIVTIASGQSYFSPYSDSENWRGFQVSRSHFDGVLLDATKRVGATVFLCESPTFLKVDTNGNIREVFSKRLRIRPHFVVDSTGRCRWLARQLRVDYQKVSPTLFAWYGYAEGGNSVTYAAPHFIWDENGWTWLASVGNDIVSWVRLDLTVSKLNRGDWLPEQLRNYHAEARAKCADVTWRVANCLSRNNWFLVGDAAFVLDPASSHGVLKALMSGIMVAHLIGQFTEELQPLIHQHYAEWSRQTFLSDCHRLKSMYNSHLAGVCDDWPITQILPVSPSG